MSSDANEPKQPDAHSNKPSSDSEQAFVEPIVVESTELFQGRREIWIQHHGQMYRLRETASGRLYLTK